MKILIKTVFIKLPVISIYYTFFYKKNLYKKMSPKTPKTLRKY